ncbi:DUF6864 domain-containing function [Lewinella sp. W8]|uniref:DUF6864 domain-containing function n=1 Tax=Lewinella sp. W8 TaxID=2528208 RepID=UPI0010682136|nr:hypothetical protein [Lewinella sp. W8]MTB51690.1 hypothetical protein [Lewinella sp. W8]
MKISIGPYEVFSSGTIVGVLNEPITFEFNGLTYRFVFIKDPDRETPHYEGRSIEGMENGIEILLINHDQDLGAGFVDPVKFGVLNGRDLYFNYRTYSLNGNNGTGGHLLHYSWLLGEKK